MPEEPANPGEGLAATPYEPPERSGGSPRLRMTAKVLLVLGLLPVLPLCAGWCLGAAGLSREGFALFSLGAFGLIGGVPLAATCMLYLALVSPGRRSRWLIASALLAVAASVGMYVSHNLRTWQLHRALAEADRLRVRTGGGCHTDPARETTLVDVRGREAVGGIVGEIRMAGSLLEGRGACECCGWPTLEFYAGARLVTTVSYHHGVNLRWHEGRWPGDTSLTDESARFLRSWLTENNATREQWDGRDRR